MSTSLSHKQPLISRFRDIGVLHRGGSSNHGIILAQDTTTGKYFVKKMLKPAGVTNGSALREFEALQQAHLLFCPFISQIAHPEIFAESQHGTLLLEYYDLGSLGDLIERHRRAQEWIPETFIRHVFWSLATALMFLQNGWASHAPPAHNWIIHGDIHPGNVFLRNESEISFPRVALGGFSSSISRRHVQIHGGKQRVERQRCLGHSQHVSNGR